MCHGPGSGDHAPGDRWPSSAAHVVLVSAMGVEETGRVDTDECRLTADHKGGPTCHEGDSHRPEPVLRGLRGQSGLLRRDVRLGGQRQLDDWYLQLMADSDTMLNIGFVKPDHELFAGRAASSGTYGVVLTIHVDDVDEAYQRAKRRRRDRRRDPQRRLWPAPLPRGGPQRADVECDERPLMTLSARPLTGAFGHGAEAGIGDLAVRPRRRPPPLSETRPDGTRHPSAGPRTRAPNIAPVGRSSQAMRRPDRRTRLPAAVVLSVVGGSHGRRSPPYGCLDLPRSHGSRDRRRSGRVRSTF